MPYLLSLGLVDGRVTVNSFTVERMNDPVLKNVMSRIKIAERKDFTSQFPGKLMTEIEVVTRDGKRIVETANYPKGHAKNPMTDADVEAKFNILCEGLMDGAQQSALVKAVWSLDQATDLTGLLDLLVFKNGSAA